MAECVAENLVAWSEDKPPLTPAQETPWRGFLGSGGSGRESAPAAHCS